MTEVDSLGRKKRKVGVNNAYFNLYFKADSTTPAEYYGSFNVTSYDELELAIREALEYYDFPRTGAYSQHNWPNIWTTNIRNGKGHEITRTIVDQSRTLTFDGLSRKDFEAQMVEKVG